MTAAFPGGRPVEVGYKGHVADNIDGVVLDHPIVVGIRPTPRWWPPYRADQSPFRSDPKAVTADRGYGNAAVDRALSVLGVGFVAIPRRGRPSPQRTAIRRQRRFVRLVKWRTGSEARINCLKRDYLWRRTLLDGHTGAQIWCGWGVLAHNATKITHLETSRADHYRHHRGSDRPTRGNPSSDVA